MKRLKLKKIKDLKFSKIKNIKFENIVDKDGHKRFQEFENGYTYPEGMEKVFSTASLSGTHLMIVIALNLSDELVISNNATLGYFELPDWIYNKIYPSIASVIEYKAFTATASDYTSQSVGTKLLKTSNNRIAVQKEGNLTLTANRYVRMSFDLLIDND